jgi:hypothetical protein
MARGEPPGKQFTKSRPTATTLKDVDTSGLSGRERAALQRANNAARVSSGRNLETIANELLDFIGDRDLIKAAMDGKINPALAGGLIAAGMVPIPGPKTAAKAVGKTVSKGKKGKKAPVGESGLTQTIGDAVGEPGQKAANEAVGRKTPKTATGSKEVTAPKDKPTANPPRREDYAHASSHSRAVSKWQKKVDAWNKSNPENQVAQATPDRLTPGRGRAATDTERQVKKAEADKSPEEKTAVARGERDASKARRDEQREAAQQDTSDLVDIEREDLTGFVGRRRKERAKPTSVTMAGMEGQGAGKSVTFKDSKKGSQNERRVDDILATMRKQLAARERAEGGTAAIRVDESGMLTPYSDPGRFTRPTMIEQQRAEAQAARFQAATGRKFPSTEKQALREGKKQDPGFTNPAAGSVEDRLQREAKAEGVAKDADDRTRMLMDDGRLSGEVESQQRAPGYPKGPYYEPRDKMDRAYDTYSGYQPDRATTAAQAEQNVRIGRAEGTVVPGRVVTPAEEIGRTQPIIGDPRIPKQRFVTTDDAPPPPRYETPYGPRGIYGTEVGGPAYPGPFGTTDAAGYATGFGYKDYNPAPSFVVDPKDYPPLPGTRKMPEKQKEFNEVKFEEPDATEAATTGAEGPKKGKKGKKGKEPKKQQQPQSGDRSPEAVRARTYEGYRELERQGILNPGDADRIMSGGTGAQKVFEETPTQAQRNKGIKPGKATREDNQRQQEAKQQAQGGATQQGSMSAAQMAERLKMPKGFTAASGTVGLAGYGLISAGGQENNDRPVIIPGEAYDSKNAFRPASRTPTSRTPDKPKQGFLKDKYGRKITREEFDRRKAFRAKRERLKGQVPGEILRQITEKEMKRRKRFRGNFGDRSAYNVATRNIGGGGTQTRVLDTDARKRLSGAFRG